MDYPIFDRKKSNDFAPLLKSAREQAANAPSVKKFIDYEWLCAVRKAQEAEPANRALLIERANALSMLYRSLYGVPDQLKTQTF